MARRRRHRGDQSDLFDGIAELFDENAAPVVYHGDPDRIRRRIANMLAEVRATQAMPWNAGELENRAYLLKQMARFLPKDEAAQFAFEFEQEWERLKAA